MPEEQLIGTSRPPTVVTFTIKINDAEIPQGFIAETIIINKEINRVPSAKIVFVDGSASEGKFEAANGSLFIPGNQIDIAAGYESDNYPLFKGIITKQSVKIRSNNSLLTIECKDEAIKTTVGAKNKYFTDGGKDSDIISSILGTYGLQPDIEATDVVHKQLVQFATTDWDFIVNRADVNGKLVMVDDGKLAVKQPDFNAAAIISLAYGATILELDMEMDARLQVKAVKSKSWSSDDQAITEAEPPNPNISLNGNIGVAQLANVIGLDEYTLKHGGAIAEAELTGWGKAFWQKHQAAKVRGRVRFKGIHTVKPGMMLELSGVSDRFNGKCFISGIQHYIAAGEWQTDAQLGINPVWFAQEQDIMCSPASGLLAGVCGLQVAVVTQLENDPDNRNRIKVFMPIVSSNGQGFWARVATLDAGNGRGSFFLPEIGDEVIVGFINDDPRDAIVLGMMNSSAKPAPLAAQDANNEKGFVTRSKMRMIFDDDKKSFTVETPIGKKITMDEDAGTIKMEDENGNKIVMDSDGISIESFKDIKMKATADFKLEAVNVEAKASAAWKAEGGTSADFKATGTTTIKGAMVNIN